MPDPARHQDWDLAQYGDCCRIPSALFEVKPRDVPACQWQNTRVVAARLGAYGILAVEPRRNAARIGLRLSKPDGTVTGLMECDHDRFVEIMTWISVHHECGG